MSDIQAILAENGKLSQEMLRASADLIDQSRRFPRENLQALGKMCLWKGAQDIIFELQT